MTRHMYRINVHQVFHCQKVVNMIHSLYFIYLPRELLGCYIGRRTKERRLVLMVTYGDLFTFVIMLCAVITLVVTIFRHKK